MASQAWLLRRLYGLTPKSFKEPRHKEKVPTSSVCLVTCSPDLEAPSAFEQSWCTFVDGAFTMPTEQLADASALLIFSSPFDPVQVKATCELVSMVDTFGAIAPPVFWIVHTVAPEIRAPEHNMKELGDEIFHIVEMGLDGILPEEREGMTLALQVRLKIQKAEFMSRTLNNIVNSKRKRAARICELKDQIHSVIWEYLCARIAPSIPPCSHKLPHNLPSELSGFLLGPLLEKGSFTSAFLLRSTEASEELQVAKFVDKENNANLQALKRIKNMAEVLQLLRKEEWRHPNLARLHEIYHSRTHIIFRMDYGGDMNLFQRLMRRENHAEGEVQELSLEKTCSIITQMLSVIAHLHAGPGVCHRDLKPEIFNLIETPETVTLKLLDLDSAVEVGSKATCGTVCGTVPFVAPEVLSGQAFDGRAADTWSLGVILLEVLTFVRILEGELPDLRQRPVELDFKMGPEIAEQLLKEHIREELRALHDAMHCCLQRMLALDVQGRCSTGEAYNYVKAAMADF